jgi:hypothetical protein
MRFKNVRTETILAAERVAVFLLMVFVVAVHFKFLVNAGGLWRDETHSFNLANMPGLRDVFDAQKIETHPVFMSLALRLWILAGFGTSDMKIRVFGLLVGLAILGALWLNARLLGYKLPTIGMLLLGLSPVIIRYGDSIRPYGLAMLFSLLAFGLYWRVTIKPSAKCVVPATLTGVIMVQCLTQNAFLLMAIGIGSMTVCLRKRLWKRAVFIAGMGFTAAISLMPYLSIWKQVKEVVFLNTIPDGNAINAMVNAFGSPDVAVGWVWIFLLAISIMIPKMDQSRVQKKNDQDGVSTGDLKLYAQTVFIFSALGYTVFLSILKFGSQPWHFVTLIAVLAACLDAIFGSWKRGALFRIVLVLILVVVLGKSVWQQIQMRQTNLDMIANHLENHVKKDDLILIYPFWYGVTFQRYYDGESKWASIPPLEDLTLHRYDLVKKRMVETNPMASVLLKVTNTLEAGNKIFVVGALPRVSSGENLPSVLPPPHPVTGWLCGPYIVYWGRQVSLALEEKALERNFFVLRTDRVTNPYENVRVEIIQGLKKDKKSVGKSEGTGSE